VRALAYENYLTCIERQPRNCHPPAATRPPWPEADTPIPESNNTGSAQRQGSSERSRFLVVPALLTLDHVSIKSQASGVNVQNAVLTKEQTMKLARVGVIAAAIFAVATVAWAQKPDFSGTWTLDPK
jgi:hypothetical protein